MNRPKIGAHVSVAGGLDKAALRAKEIGAECIQIFAGSPRRYEISIPEKIKLDAGPVFVHASYLLNLASEDDALREKSITSLYETLFFSDAVGAVGVIYHPGSPKGGDKEKAIEREAQSVKRVLSQYTGNSLLLLENTAGKKKIGVSAEEIGDLVQKISSNKVGACIDTAHAFESGDITEFNKEGVEKWIKEWDEKVGLLHVHALHINDSMTEKGSQHDRHANIGEGFIGKKGFSFLVQNGSFSDIPWIIETPGFDGKGPDKKNIDILKSLF